MLVLLSQRGSVTQPDSGKCVSVSVWKVLIGTLECFKSTFPRAASVSPLCQTDTRFQTHPIPSAAVAKVIIRPREYSQRLIHPYPLALYLTAFSQEGGCNECFQVSFKFSLTSNAAQTAVAKHPYAKTNTCMLYEWEKTPVPWWRSLTPVRKLELKMTFKCGTFNIHSSASSVRFCCLGNSAPGFQTKVFFFTTKTQPWLRRLALVWMGACFNHKSWIRLRLFNEARSSWKAVGAAALISGPWTRDYAANTPR